MGERTVREEAIVGTRGEALAAFEDARDLFVSAYDGVPDEALAYLKPGDDYALGGLVVHAITVVEHYQLVLDTLLAAGFRPSRAEDPPGFWEAAAAAAREGLQPADRARAFSDLRRRHVAFVEKASAVPESDWERQADVFYGEAAEAYPTSPADVCGWLIAHYLEHIPQVQELLEDWQTQPGRSTPPTS
jgi:hypothetical protein